MKWLLSFLFSVTLFLSSLFSQTDTKFQNYLETERAQLPVPGDLLYDGANIGSYRYGGGSGATKRIVDADPDLPFGKTLQLTVKQAGSNAWEPQLQSPSNNASIKKDDVLFYIFHIRLLDSADPSGNGKGFFYVQRNSSPWTGLGSSSLTFTPAWRKVYVVAQAGQDYAANTVELTIHLGFYAQKVEIGGIIALNLGQNIDIVDLPRNPLYWDGMDAAASWRNEAAERIERVRKGDLNVVVKNQNGDAVKNALIRVKMKNHAYGFGTFIANLVNQNTANANKYKEALLSLFNRATTPFYMGDGSWGWYRSEANRQEYRDMAQWLYDQNMPTKGHVLIWPSWNWMPPFFRDYENDPEGMRESIDEHLETVVPVGQERGLVEWDVVNEPHINHDIMDICGDDIMVHWYKKVHELDPEPRLILNEYNILMGGGGDPAFQADLEKYIELLIDGGAPLGGLGLQCHFDENLPGIPRVLEILDRFAKYNLPIQITEFDINTVEEEGQAHFTRDFYTAVFSHPITDKIVMWGFWEGDMWKPNGAMIRTDWSYKPNYDVYTDLIFNEWWSDEEGRSSRDGAYQTRGFLGDYEISVTFDGHTMSQQMSLTKEGAEVHIQLPTIETGVNQSKESPVDFDLQQNYPNPFNSSTVITFTSPQSGDAELIVSNMRGAKVFSKKMNVCKGGHYRQELSFDFLPTGLYIYAVQFSNRSSMKKKMILIK